jgi:ketosteroid isomerase-like protein
VDRSNVDVVRELFDRFGGDGLESALELISEDFVVEVPGSLSAEPDVYEGHAGARRYFAGFDGLMENVRFEAIDLVEEGDAVIVWLRLSGPRRGEWHRRRAAQRRREPGGGRQGQAHGAVSGHGRGPRGARGVAGSVARCADSPPWALP